MDCPNRTLESIRPCEALRPYVRAYAERSIHISDQSLLAHVPARLEQILEFQFADPFGVHFEEGGTLVTPRTAVVGPQTSFRATVEFRGRVRSFGVFFQPSGFSRLFGIPMRFLFNAAEDAFSLVGRDARSLWNQLGESPDFAARVAAIEAFLKAALSRVRPAPRILHLSDQLLARRGMVRIDTLARQYGMSRRGLERAFLSETGATPKCWARIARFQTALDMKLAFPAMTWLEISLALGYFDQMHLVHDFRKLGGRSPDRLLDHLVDMRPQALASAFQYDSPVVSQI